MAKKKRKLSTRLIRKGALIEETYTAFRHWDLSQSIKDNILQIREGNLIGAKNDGWLHEILTTISSRFPTPDDLEPLVILAKGNLDITVWKACLLWHIGNIDELYYRFATDWLFKQFNDGAYLLRTEDVLPFVRKTTDGRIASGGKLTDYGALRAARDLLRMAADFGVLEGSARKKFANFHIPQDAFIYVLHGLFDDGINAAGMLSKKCWRMFLMDAEDVERELFRLHQFNVLDYQTVGSMASLRLPYKSLSEYARKLVE